MERYVNNWLKQNKLLKGSLRDQSISSLINHRPLSHDCVTFSSLSGTVCSSAKEHINTHMYASTHKHMHVCQVLGHEIAVFKG